MQKRNRGRQFLGLKFIAALLIFLFFAPGKAVSAENVTLFVTSESTDRIGVYRGAVPALRRVKRIRTGRNPHNMGISPNGRWVVSGDRFAEQLSVIDTKSLKRIAVVKTGKHPHDFGFSADSKLLYVGHERETFINVFETGTWKKRSAIEVGLAQHDISLSPDGRELWFTVTNQPYRKGLPRVGIVSLTDPQKKVQMLDSGRNAHDVIFGPAGRIVWVTNGGFIGYPDPHVNFLDPKTRRVLGQIRVGRYPFHGPKRGRDGNYLPVDAKQMWFSDRGTSSVIAVDIASRKIVSSVPVGKGPFHVAVTPKGVLFVANNESNTVTIIDGAAKAILRTLRVDKKPHGLAVLLNP